jgi:hypothetical protein
MKAASYADMGKCCYENALAFGVRGKAMMGDKMFSYWAGQTLGQWSEVNRNLKPDQRTTHI